MLNLFQPIEFSRSKFDSLDPTYQTSKARIRQVGKAVGKREKKFHQPGIFSYSLKHDVNSCTLTCFLKKTSSFHAKMKKFQVDRSSTIRYTHMAHREVVISIQKQTKNSETGSDLSLGTHLTVLSKRLGRKRCCDTTPDRCLRVCRLIIFASHC